MAQIRLRDIADFDDEQDFGPSFEAFKKKPKRKLPKIEPHLKTDATEATDRQISGQIRGLVPLNNIEILPLVPNAGGDFPVVRKNGHGSGVNCNYAMASRVGLAPAELAQHYDRERKRYNAHCAQTEIATPGRARARYRNSAYTILKGFANGMAHPEAKPVAYAALHKLLAAANAKQLGHVLKVIDCLQTPLPLIERLHIAQAAPPVAFYNVRIQKKLLDRVLRHPETGAPRIFSELSDRPIDLLRCLPEFAEGALRHMASGRADADCVTPGDYWRYLEDLANHPARPGPFYVALLEDCIRNIKRVPRQPSLRRRAQPYLEAAFATSARLLEDHAPRAAEIKPPPAASAAAARPPAARRRTAHQSRPAPAG